MNRIAVCIGLAITLLIPAIVNAIEIDIEDTRATVTGTVYSVNTGETVPFATVRVVGTRIGAISNEKGIYEINGLPPGEWQLKISLLGYKEITREINVAANDIHHTNIYIKEVPIPMAEVEVRGESKQDEKLTSVDTGSDINLSIIGSRPGMVDDLLRQVQELPQVKARSDFSSKMYVRGSGPEHNIVYIDGIPAYNPYRAFGVVSSFNPDLVEKARLYPGGFPAEFGGRLSAVLDVKYKSGTKKKIKPSLDINALAAGGILEGPLFSDNNTYIFSGRRTYYDLFLDSRDAHTVYPHFYDMYGKITFGKNSKNRIDILGWHNGEGFRLNQNKDESDDRSYYARATNSGYSTAQSVNWQHMHSQSLMFETRLYNVGENRKLNMIGDIAADFDSYFKETALEGQALWMNNIGEFKTGFFTALGRERVDWDGYNFPDSLDQERPPDAPDIRPIQEHFHYNKRYTQWAAYLSGNMNLTDRWIISNGYRFSGGGIVNHYAFSPRWGLTYKPGIDYKISYSGGIYFQAPTYKAFLEKNYLPELHRNPDILPEEAIHHIVDFVWLPDSDWDIGLSVYHKSLDKLIYDTPGDPFYDYAVDRTNGYLLDDDVPMEAKGLIGAVNGQFLLMRQNAITPENNGSGYVNGLEISLIRNSESKLNGNIFYSLSKTKLNTPIGDYCPNYDQRHTLTAALDYDFTKKWTLSMHYRYGSGYPYTEVIGREEGFYSDDIPWIPVWGEVNSARYPYYSRVDLRLTHNFKWAESKWRFYLEVINLLNRKNIYAYTYDREYLNRSEITQLPILPNFGISIDF